MQQSHRVSIHAQHHIGQLFSTPTQMPLCRVWTCNYAGTERPAYYHRIHNECSQTRCALAAAKQADTTSSQLQRQQACQVTQRMCYLKDQLSCTLQACYCTFHTFYCTMACLYTHSNLLTLTINEGHMYIHTVRAKCLICVEW